MPMNVAAAISVHTTSASSSSAASSSDTHQTSSEYFPRNVTSNTGTVTIDGHAVNYEGGYDNDGNAHGTGCAKYTSTQHEETLIINGTFHHGKLILVTQLPLSSLSCYTGPVDEKCRPHGSGGKLIYGDQTYTNTQYRNGSLIGCTMKFYDGIYTGPVDSIHVIPHGSGGIFINSDGTAIYRNTTFNSGRITNATMQWDNGSYTGPVTSQLNLRLSNFPRIFVQPHGVGGRYTNADGDKFTNTNFTYGTMVSGRPPQHLRQDNLDYPDVGLAGG